jgi:predicted DsbA family dithiol-disulfide isomerase
MLESGHQARRGCRLRLTPCAGQPSRTITPEVICSVRPCAGCQWAYFGWNLCGFEPLEDEAMSALKPLKIDIVSDVVCPWCYIGKKRIEDALALVPDVPIEVRWRPFFLNPWVPREGISREDYLTTKFGSVDAYKGIAGRVVTAAGEEGLVYRPDLVKRQPNTIDCHRLIHWADARGKAAEMKQRLMELYFRDGGDLTDPEVLIKAAADVGLDADDVRKRLATDEDVGSISDWAQEASDKGISGVPTYVFAQKYAVSGAQPAEMLARAIRQVSAEINAQAAE